MRKLPTRRRGNVPVVSTQASSAADYDVPFNASESASSLSNATRPQSSRKPSTPMKLRLRQKIRQLHSQRWKMSRKIKSLQSLTTPTSSNYSRTGDLRESVLAEAKTFITPLQLSLFRAQLQQHKPKYRWSVKDKLFALQLRCKSASAFRLFHSI